MKKLKVLFYSSICLLAASCHFNSSSTNSQADVDEAEAFGTKFYNLVKSGNFEKTYPLFSKEFFEATDTPALKAIFSATLSNLGEIKEIKVEQCATEVVHGTDARSEYAIAYKIERSKYASEEVLQLQKQNGKIRIMSYKVNSEDFVTSGNKNSKP
jgi:hypothetical protein